MVNESRFSWSQADVGRGPAAVRALSRPPRRPFPARSTDPIVAGGLHGHHHRRLLRRIGPRPHRLTGLPAEVPAHEPGRVHRHGVVAARQPHAEGRRRHHRADAEPVHRRARDARRAALPERFTGNPMGDYLLGYVADLQLSNVWVVEQRHWASMFFVQDDWKASPKLTVNLGLRYDFITPALEAANRPDQLRPRGRGQPGLRRATGRSRSAGLVKPDRNNFAPADRRRLQARREDGPPRRLGHLLQPLRPRRQRGPARTERARPRQQQHHPDLGRRRCSSSATGCPQAFLNAPNLDPAAGQLRSACGSARSRTMRPRPPSSRRASGIQRELSEGMSSHAGLRLHQGHEPGRRS